MWSAPAMEPQPSGTPETSGHDAGAERLPQDRQRSIQSSSTKVRGEQFFRSRAGSYRGPNAYDHQSNWAPNDAFDRDVQLVQPASSGTSFSSSSQPSAPHAPINDSPNLLISSCGYQSTRHFVQSSLVHSRKWKRGFAKEVHGGIPVLHGSEGSTTDPTGLLGAIYNTHTVFLPSLPFLQ
ncbi:unnamed protein product [Somion occarium]|uniref:Uncharacterized protein n=1 Tax=Somion occarium TaxID=3059160 RepID=A0ABP1E3L1_9APHY